MDLFNDAATGFNLYYGNRLEQLAETLAVRLGDCRDGDPLNSDLIVVQSRGMARWLNMSIAASTGVSANLTFPFPKNFINDHVFAPLTGNKVDFSRFAPENMTWRLVAIIPGLLDEPEFQVLNKYLAGDNRNLKLIQLSERLAGLFDQYLTYRPDVINAWDRGFNPLQAQPDSIWQQQLWKLATAGYRRQHPAFYYQALLEQVYPEIYPPERRIYHGQADFSSLENLQRVFFFGFSSIAPVYLDIVFAVSKLIKVDFFYLNPCAEYWEYNRPYRQLLQEAGKKLQTRVACAEIKSDEDFNAVCGESGFECANPLLGSWGEQGREFFALINSANPTNEEPLFFSEPVGPDTKLLDQLRFDIENLTVTKTERPFDLNDNSMQFHSCHSRMREVEVLYENLLHLFVRQPDLQPEDILVLTPDINVYAPYIEAVFNTVNPDSPKWFYATIADRSDNITLPEVAAWFKLLSLDRDRFKVSAVLDLLELEAVRNRCGIDDDDLDRLRLWLKDNGINWGIDAAYHQEKCGFSFDQNSWQFGLDRMLSGFAMMDSRALWQTDDHDILPYNNIEGDGAVLLGKLCDFFARLTALHDRLRAYEANEETPEAWRVLLSQAVDDFLAADKQNIDGIQVIRTAITGWFEEIRRGGGEHSDTIKIDLAGVLYCLRQRLEDNGSTGGFLRGGVTFCQAKPLRSIPAKVICMLGMDEKSFPRKDRKSSFDLTAIKPRLGDRSARNDDRYLFLETLLSAGRIFYISYVGQSIKENTSLPPSVTVSELLDYLAANYIAFEPGESAAEHRQRVFKQLVITHPLQAFSRKYFTTGTREELRLVSYSEENCHAAMELSKSKEEDQPQGNRAMTCNPDIALGEEFRTVTIRELADFLKNPQKTFCCKRIGINLDIKDGLTPEDREPFSLNALDKYSLADDLLRQCLRQPAGRNMIAQAEIIKGKYMASGLLPVGAQGEMEFDRFQQDFTPFFNNVRQVVGEPLPAITTTVNFPELALTLEIMLDGLYQCHDGKVRQVFFRLGKKRAADELQNRLYHLILGLSEVRNSLRELKVTETILFAKDGNIICDVGIPDPATAANGIKTIAATYLKGMYAPLEFEPAASLAASQALQKGLLDEAVLNCAAAKWPVPDSDYSRYDEYLAFCFGDRMPENQDFSANFIGNVKLIFNALPPIGGKS